MSYILVKPQYNKYRQSCFNAVFSTPMNMRWLNFPFQPNINAETTLGHQHWTNVALSTLFQRCFVNVETTSVNIRRLNFHFQPNFNGETTLVHRRWIDVILSTVFQRCFVNVETKSINVRRLNFHFQPNINIETTLMNVDNPCCFNVICWVIAFSLEIFFFQWTAIFHKFFMFHLLYFLSYQNTIKHGYFPPINKIMNFAFKI